MAQPQPSGDNLSTWSAARKSGEKKSRRKWLGRSLIITAVLALLLLALAPTIASPFVPGVIESQSSSIAGDIEVRSTRLAWFATQRIQGVQLKTPAGDTVATIDLELEDGLASLLLSGLHPTRLHIAGDIDIARDASGELNITTATASTSTASNAPSQSPPAIPSLLRGFAVDIDNLNVSYADASLNTPQASLATLALDGVIEITANGDLQIKLDAPTQIAGADANAARVIASASVTNLLAADGALNLDTAVIDADINAGEFPLAPLAQAGLLDQNTAAALGKSIGLRVEASGTLADAIATIAINTPEVRVNAPLRYEQPASRLSAREPITLAASPAAVRALMTAPDGLTIDEYPGVNAAIDRLAFNLPTGGALSLADLALTANATIDAWSATVAVAGEAAPRAASFEPLSITLTTDRLADGARLHADTRVNVDGRSAGALTADLTVAGLLDTDGAPRLTGIPRVDGRVAAENVDLETFQPFAEPFGLQLASDIGPQLNLALTAEPRDGATFINATANAEHATIDAAARVTGNNITLQGDGATLTLQRLGRFLDAALTANNPDQPTARIQSAGPLVLRVPTAVIDITRLTAGDLAGASATLELELTSITGSALAPNADPDADPQPFALRDFSAALDARDPAGLVNLTATASAQYANRPAGDLSVNLDLGGLLDNTGALSSGLPARVNGAATLSNLSLALLNPFINVEGLDLTRDIGDTADLALEASAAQGDAIQLRATATAANLTAEAALALEPDRLRSTAPILIEHKAAGPVIRSLLATSLPENAKLTGGAATLRVTNLDIPLDTQSRQPDIARATADVETRLTQMRLTGSQPEATINTLTAAAALRPDAPINAQLALAGESATPFSASADIQAINALATNTNATTNPAPQFDGLLTATNFPASLADALVPPIETPSAESIPLSELARLVGAGSLDLSLTLTPAGASATDLTARVSGPALAVNAQGAIDLANPSASQNLTADANTTVPPEAFNRLLALFAPNIEPRPTLREPTRIELTAQREADDLTATIRVPSARFAAMQVGESNRVGPFGLSINLTTTAGAAILEGAEATVALNADARFVRDDGASLGALTAEASTSLASGAPNSAINAAINVTDLDTTILDTFAGGPGAASGALGKTLNLTVNLDTATDATGAMSALDATAEINASRLATSRPIRATLRNDVLRLENPADITWDVDPAWINAKLKGDAEEAPKVTIASMSGVRLHLDKLVAPMGPSASSELQVAAELRADEITTSITNAGESHRYRDLNLAVGTTSNPGEIELTGALTAPNGARALNLSGAVANLVDDTGALNPANAITTANLELSEIPTVLIQALAGVGFNMTDMLGDNISATANLERFPAAGGTASLHAKSPKALVDYDAAVEQTRSGRLFIVARGQPRVELQEFNTSERFNPLRVLPLLADFQKSKDQDPAEMVFSRLILPVDGAIRDVDIEADFDPGQANFRLAGGFTRILKVFDQRKEGEAGNRIDPMHVTMRDGILEITEINLPVGEFLFPGYGVANFREEGAQPANEVPPQHFRFRLGVPITAFAGEVVGGGLSILPGGQIFNDAATVPTYISGPMGGEVKIKPAFDEVPKNFIQSLGKNLIESPAELLKKGIKDILPKPKP